MFKSLDELVRLRGSLSLLISPEGEDKLRVFILPATATAPQGAEPEEALRQPLSLCATPEELDAGFVGAVSGYTAAMTTLQQQVNDTLAVIDAAKKTQQKRAANALTGKAGAPKASGASPGFKPNIASSDDDGDDGGDDDDSGASGDANAAPATPPTEAASAASAKDSAPAELTADLF